MANAIGLLNCGDFTGAATLEYVQHNYATAAGAGVNYWGTMDAGGLTTIELGGIEYQMLGFWADKGTGDGEMALAVRKNRGA